MVCKKCKRPLPEGSKKKLCENCIGKRAQHLKTAVGIGTVVLSAVVLVITKGKINPQE